jgi:hypothetical protein
LRLLCDAILYCKTNICPGGLAKNMGKVDKKEVFAGLSQEIEAAAAKEAADKAQEAAESERKRKLLEYNMAYTEDRAANAEIPKTATLSEAIALLRTALGVVRNRVPLCDAIVYSKKH